MMGKKLQIHLTFKCNVHCAFCPIPSDKLGKDHMEFEGMTFAGSELSGLLLRAYQKVYAQGAAISGGEPLLVLPRVIRTIDALKWHFGSSFHIHLYTNGTTITSERLIRLSRAGLDELRVNSLDKRVFERLADVPFEVVCEVPCIPQQRYYDAVCRLVDSLPRWRVAKLNLNELEITRENLNASRQFGLEVENHRATASRQFATAIHAYAVRFSPVDVFFCSFENAERIRIARNRLQKGDPGLDQVPSP